MNYNFEKIGKTSSEEKRYQLFLEQKKTLELLLERNAITYVQYDKSLGVPISQME